jgi:hypothetical protein
MKILYLLNGNYLIELKNFLIHRIFHVQLLEEISFLHSPLIVVNIDYNIENFDEWN